MEAFWITTSSGFFARWRRVGVQRVIRMVHRDCRGIFDRGNNLINRRWRRTYGFGWRIECTAAAFRIRCLRGRLVEIYENYSRLPRFRVFMHQRFSLSLSLSLSFFFSLSFTRSLFRFTNVATTSGRTLRSPLFCPATCRNFHTRRGFIQ